MDSSGLNEAEEPTRNKVPTGHLRQPRTPGSEQRRWWLFLSVGAVALAAIWLYRRALTFAFFNDDPSGHFAWMEGRPVWQFFSSSAEYGYYRPVVFFVLRLMEIIFGDATFPHNPLADHALLVLLHGANTALVWLLAYRLSRRSLAYAWIAALVFAALPFSYEAVAYVASLTHPLHVFWLLAALLLFDRGRETADRRYLVSSGLTMILALLTHENGLFIFPAMIGLDFVARPGVSLRERARALWPFALPPLLFAILWLAIPKNSQQGLNALTDIGRNLLPFLQSLAYPVLPLLNLDTGDAWVLAAIAAGLVVALGLLAWRLGALRLWAFALGWVFLAALPAILFLSPAYVFGSPRLSYLPAVGVALLWAIPGLLVRRASTDFADFADFRGSDGNSAGDRARIVVTTVLVLAYIIGLTYPALPFIRCQLDFYDETSRIARQMASAAGNAPDGRDVVFVNLPFFFSSFRDRPDGCSNAYPWTPTGGILIPPYAQARDFVRFNGGPDRPVRDVSFPDYAPGWRTAGPEITEVELRQAISKDFAYVFDLPSGDFIDLTAIWQPDGRRDAPLVSFGEVLKLTRARFETTRDQLAVDLAWSVDSPTAIPLSAFVHVYDRDGALVAQADGPPGTGFVPQSLWREGDALRDSRQIDIAGLPAGRYTVGAGVYSQLDGIRLPATQDGRSLPDDVYVVGIFER